MTISVIISYHDPVMAFSGSMEEIQMCNHGQIELKQKVVENKTVDDCVSICCYDKDFSNTYFSNVNNWWNKKKLEKIKLSFDNFDLSYFDISSSKLITNIAPPIIKNYIIKNNYIYLIWIIKSNT